MHKLLYLFFLFPLGLSAQGKFLLYLKNKPMSGQENVLSERSQARRAAQKIPFSIQDFPVSSDYVLQLKNLGWEIVGKSKWLNAVLVSGSDSLLIRTRQLPFIAGVEDNADIRGDVHLGKYARTITSPVTPINYGSTATQIRMLNADTMHLRGYMGKDVLVAVMDGGFSGLKTAEAFKHLDVVHTYNYVHNTEEVDRDDTHGTNVLSLIAGFIPGKLSGTAPEASVALYTTEDVIPENETKLEEVYWVLAAEHADSLGADVINTSLGYSKFTDPNQDYTYQEMDGKTALISKAANYAASVGIIVVIAAGNEGNSTWRYISAPADAQYVIAVGAVNGTKQIASFSSYGPSPDGRIKPEVSAQGVATVFNNNGDVLRSGNGTSYAAPLIAGLMAGLRQQFPSLSALQLREILIKSADRYTQPDSRYGYGIPNYTRAVKIALSEYLVLGSEIENRQLTLFPNPNTGTFTLMINGISLSPTSAIEIWSSDGRKIGSGEIRSDRWKELSEGLYFVRPEKTDAFFKMLIKK
jgi:serine protease AprX